MLDGTKREKTARRPEEKLEALRGALAACEAVVVGAGSGLSTAAGYHYSGAVFERYFADFIAKYGIRDMYTGGFYPFASPEEYWAWWSRHIWLNRYAPIPNDVYEKLLALLRDRNYFVLTTNVDHCFQRSGFDKARLFYTQGDYGLFQSSRPQGRSRHKTYANEEAVREMLLSQGFGIARDGSLILPEGRVPATVIDSALIPYCPDDGAPMMPNLRSDERFVEDEGWRRAAGRYADFIRTHEGRAVLYWELGVGGNTPGIIKYPFWRMTAENERARYACLNLDDAAAPREIAERSICIRGDIGEVLEVLNEGEQAARKQ